MPTQEELDALQTSYTAVVAERDQLKKSLDTVTSDRDTYRDSNLKNQQGWDAEIQSRKDDAEVSAKAIKNYKVAHEQVIALLSEPPDVRALRVQQAQDLADLQKKLS